MTSKDQVTGTAKADETEISELGPDALQAASGGSVGSDLKDAAGWVDDHHSAVGATIGAVAGGIFIAPAAAAGAATLAAGAAVVATGAVIGAGVADAADAAVHGAEDAVDELKKIF
ncbi:hypothetical protein [Martelella sp. HB161492]|uniref:hypothetical protein n=1 Tax=Martelella sp. HB161492 TaxID=2720726 RepID=UPI0015924885|nr:hypothetical protein [Martelella sp. HB161492]